MTEPRNSREDRETVAKREIGQTEITPARARALSLTFIFMLLVMPLAAHILHGLGASAGTGLPAPWHIVPRALNAVRAVAGEGLFQANRRVLRSIRQTEDEVDDSLLRAACLPAVQTMLSRWLGTGNEKVYTGLHGWLFYRPAIDHLTGRGFLTAKHTEARRCGVEVWEEPPQPNPTLAVAAFARQLAGRGIRLVVMPVPGKATLHPDRFSSRYAGTPGVCPRNISDAAFEEAVRSIPNAELFDPTPLLANAASSTGRPQYLATDTHWTPEAVEHVAKALGERLGPHLSPRPASGGPNSLVGYLGLPLRAWARHRGTQPGLSSPERWRAEPAEVMGQGDLVRMLSLPEPQHVYPDATVTVRRVLGPDRTPWKPDPAAPVLLLGDSFSNIYSDASLGWGDAAGLAAHLSRALACPVDAIIRNDGGAYATRLELANQLRRGNDRLAGKKVVVWQFAARELSFGDWRVLPLPTPASPTPPSRPEHQALHITATVTASGTPVRPRSGPYRNHLNWLVVDRAADPVALDLPKRLLVYVEDLHDDRPAAAAAIRTGQTVCLQLQPWDTVPTNVQRTRRADPDDDDLLLLDPFFGVLTATEAAGGTASAEPERGEPQGSPERRPLAAVPRGAGAPGTASFPIAVEAAKALRNTCARLAAAGDEMTVRAADGWLFHRTELRQMALESLTGAEAVALAPERKPEHADPLSAIADYAKACRDRGISLWVVPIPAKSAVYPDHLDAALSPPPRGQRLDIAHAVFYRKLGEAGVTVIDPMPLFLAHRDGSDGPVFCRTDTHISPRACVLLGEHLAARIRAEPWTAAVARRQYTATSEKTTITGDLLRALAADAPEPEELILRRINPEGGSGRIEPDSSSPVLLLSDSHGLVFHDGGDMHAVGAGLPDQLAYGLGFPVDLIAVRGSAARPARINLYRHTRRDPAYLAGKKVIIWCFTVRELTASPWGTIPLAK